MIVRDHPALSLSRQCRLLSLGRSSLYYEPKGESAETLLLMRRIDELLLKYPFYGARRMALHLRREGVRIGRRRAARLMRLMGLQSRLQNSDRFGAAQEHPSWQRRPRTAIGAILIATMVGSALAQPPIRYFRRTPGAFGRSASQEVRLR